MGNLFPQSIETTFRKEVLSESTVGTNFPSKGFPGIIMNETERKLEEKWRLIEFAKSNSEKTFSFTKQRSIWSLL